MALVIAACSRVDDNVANRQPGVPFTTPTAVVEELSEVTARDRIQSYLQETLDALPQGTRLTALPDKNEGRVDENLLRASPLVQCDGDLNNTTGPVRVQVLYWISGVPTGQGQQIFDVIERNWRDRGWNVAEPEASIQATATTPDGYPLSVRQGSTVGKLGDDIVYIAGISPCFPKSAVGTTTTPLPTVIAHR